jgi:hypothetical protein
MTLHITTMHLPTEIATPNVGRRQFKEFKELQELQEFRKGSQKPEYRRRSAGQTTGGEPDFA